MIFQGKTYILTKQTPEEKYACNGCAFEFSLDGCGDSSTIACVDDLNGDSVWREKTDV